MPEQYPLFPTNPSSEIPPRMPDYFCRHYQHHGECFHCRSKLNHELHAYNHWKKYHLVNVKPKPEPQRFFVWMGDHFREVGVMTYLVARYENRATAHTKPRGTQGSCSN